MKAIIRKAKELAAAPHGELFTFDFSAGEFSLLSNARARKTVAYIRAEKAAKESLKDYQPPANKVFYVDDALTIHLAKNGATISKLSRKKLQDYIRGFAAQQLAVADLMHSKFGNQTHYNRGESVSIFDNDGRDFIQHMAADFHRALAMSRA